MKFYFVFVFGSIKPIAKIRGCLGCVRSRLGTRASSRNINHIHISDILNTLHEYIALGDFFL